jgi:hypothetical protein
MACMKRTLVSSAFVAAGLVVVGAAHSQPARMQKFPDVLSAEVRAAGEGRFDFDVTVSSPYDMPQRYADGIRVRSRDGQIYGVRKLFHDHASEQPFTRDVYGVKIEPGVGTVVVDARDMKFGWGGKTIEVALPRR